MNLDLPAKMKVRKMLGGNIHEAGKIIIEKRKHPVKDVGGINYSKLMKREILVQRMQVRLSI